MRPSYPAARAAKDPLRHLQDQRRGRPTGSCRAAGGDLVSRESDVFEIMIDMTKIDSPDTIALSSPNGACAVEPGPRAGGVLVPISSEPPTPERPEEPGATSLGPGSPGPAPLDSGRDDWPEAGARMGGSDKDGLRWSFELDLDAVFGGAGRPQAGWDDIDQEEDLAAELAARDRDDAPPPGELSGAIAETLAAGPSLAAWLSSQAPGAAAGRDLIGMAEAFRRVASWAQAGELAMVAQVAAQSAAADPRTGLAADGRPAGLTEDATAQVSLGLTLSHYGAEAWTSLAVALRWRLPATAAALAEGRIDTYRAKILAEAVIPLSDAAARAVEDRVIPLAGDLTYGQLHAAVRRAVRAVDPEGAEHRREAAERRAKVSLYPDQDGTATLAGTRLPAPEATAAYARICAIAQGLKAAGAGGGIHFLRAQALIGQILGTLPPTPAPADGPPDAEPPDAEPPPGGGEPPGGRDGGTPEDRDVPPLTDADLPREDRYGDGVVPRPGGYVDWNPDGGDPLEDHFASTDPAWPWPPIPPVIPAGAPAPAPDAGSRPPGGLLDLTLSWATLTGAAPDAGLLGRIGPIAAVQARQLALLADRGGHTQWRVLLTDAGDRCLAVARVPRKRRSAGREPPGGTSVVGRVTVILPAAELAAMPPAARPGTAGTYTQLIAAARQALAAARQRAAADREAADGCAHAAESASYRPPARIREYVAARDETCRYPSCGQPAWRGDLDHTRPWDQGGRTCRCNLGALCRRHHRLKQLPGWALAQPEPGTFRWTTPAGLSYPARPARYAA
jgi:Domain of unknown function (DUF222)